MDRLRVEFDVTGLDEAQISALAGEVTAQAEESDDHPDVPVAHCAVNRGVAVGCTGYLDDFGVLVHDGETCPVHEEPASIVVRLSGDDVLGIEGVGAARVEVRQYHADHLTGLGHEDDDEYGHYEVVTAVSVAAPVTAGPPPGPSALTASAVYRGVTGTVEILDAESEQHVAVRFFIDPPPPGIDRLVYSHQAVRAPEAPDA